MISKFIVEPLKGIGAAEFGESMTDIRNKLGVFDSFKRTPMSKTKTDYFRQHDLYVYYDEHCNAEAFEFGDNANVELNQVELSRLTYDKLLHHIASLDKNLEIDTDDFTSHNIGFGGGRSMETNGWENIIVFKNGYYA